MAKSVMTRARDFDDLGDDARGMGEPAAGGTIGGRDAAGREVAALRAVGGAVRARRISSADLSGAVGRRSHGARVT